MATAGRMAVETAVGGGEREGGWRWRCGGGEGAPRFEKSVLN